MKTRICIITAGHLSTCPRMLKAADAFHEAGYEVRVVSSRHVDWAWEADLEVYKRRSWQWTVVDYGRQSCSSVCWQSRLRMAAAQKAAGLFGSHRIPFGVAVRAYARVHPELVRVAISKPTDFFYGGTTGGIAAVAESARRRNVRFGLDLEDFHSSEQLDSTKARLAHALVERVEQVILHKADFLTAGSQAIAREYELKYGVRPLAIHNTFSLPAERPTPRTTSPLRLYWFSQTIGPNRGLEDVIRAVKIARINCELHLRGNPQPQYLDKLRRQVQKVRKLQLIHHDPADPDSMLEKCRDYDVGLALEPGFSRNNLIALSNKAFTYIQAGLAVAMTDTPGQRPLAEDLGEGAILYRPGDAESLAAGLKRWANDPEKLAAAKAAAWKAAKHRWHWEHPLERGTLLDETNRVMRAA